MNMTRVLQDSTLAGTYYNAILFDRLNDCNRAQAKAAAEAFAYLAFTSSFRHGSQTHLSDVLDVIGIGLVGHAAYQAAVAHLPSYGTDPVITDLSLTARPFSSRNVMKEVADIFLDLPIDEWGETFLALEVPSFYISNAAMIFYGMTLVLEDEVVDSLLPVVAMLFEYPDDDKAFLMDEFMPRIRRDTSHITLTDEQRSQLMGDFLGTMIKVGYGFVWQEQGRFRGFPITISLINQLGADLIPLINGIANNLVSFPVYDQDMEDGINTYPGWEWCNYDYAHSKYHVEFGPGMVDSLFLADSINSITKTFKTEANDKDGQLALSSNSMLLFISSFLLYSLT